MAHSSLSSLFDVEVQDLAKEMASMNIVIFDTESFSKDEVVSKLAGLQCPFTWKSISDCTRNVVITTEEKLQNIEDETEVFIAWTKFVLNLILCYEYASTGLLESALEKQQECHLIVEHALLSNVSVPVMSLGLKHVSDACKIFLLIKSKLYEKAIETLHYITDVEKMDCREQASIWGVRGAFYMEYGLEGMKESVTVMKKALKIDSNCGEWHFLLGKALSRVRRIENNKVPPEKEELEALENAVKLTNNSFYMVLLAQSYMDASHFIFVKKIPLNYNLLNLNVHTDLKSLAHELKGKACELYKKAYENSKDNSYVLGRCANGFQKLSHPWKNMKLAKECIDRGLEKNSSNMYLIQIAAEIYLKLNEKDKAKYYFARAAENGSSSACLALSDIKYKENKLYDPVPDMERYINNAREKPSREYLLAYLGGFYYFVKHDFNTALKYWQQLMDSDMHSTRLQEFYSNGWIGVPRTCNIGKIIITEVLKRLESCNEDEKIIYNNVLVMYKKHDPQLVESIQCIYHERPQNKHHYVSRRVPPRYK